MVHKILGNCGHQKEREESSAGRLKDKRDTERGRRKLALVWMEGDRKRNTASREWTEGPWLEMVKVTVEMNSL